MVNVFFIHTNPELISHLSKALTRACTNVNIQGFESHITQETEKFCNLHRPDVIISKKNDHSSLKQVLRFEYIPFTIYDEDSIKQSILKLTCQIRKLSSNTVYSHKISILNNRKNIFNTLVKLKFNPDLCGTTYLLDCILCLRENPYSQVTYKNITKSISNVAIKYGISVETVIWNIRVSIDEMFDCTSSDFRIKMYGTATYMNYQALIQSIYLL